MLMLLEEDGDDDGFRQNASLCGVSLMRLQEEVTEEDPRHGS